MGSIISAAKSILRNSMSNTAISQPSQQKQHLLKYKHLRNPIWRIIKTMIRKYPSFTASYVTDEIVYRVLRPRKRRQRAAGSSRDARQSWGQPVLHRESYAQLSQVLFANCSSKWEGSDQIDDQEGLICRGKFASYQEEERLREIHCNLWWGLLFLPWDAGAYRWGGETFWLQRSRSPIRGQATVLLGLGCHN